MKNLFYSTRIKASIEKVWDTMLDFESYKKWAKAFSSESQYDGEWIQGTYIKFIDPNMGGTKAFIEEMKPLNRIHVKHVAIINKDCSEDTESDIAKNWLGITETYRLKETSGVCQLDIEIHTHEDYVGMFNDGWPNAIRLLKDICEK